MPTQDVTCSSSLCNVVNLSIPADVENYKAGNPTVMIAPKWSNNYPKQGNDHPQHYEVEVDSSDPPPSSPVSQILSEPSSTIQPSIMDASNPSSIPPSVQESNSENNNFVKNPNDLVKHLSLQSLRVELHRRRLSTIGLRPALEDRLIFSLQQSCTGTTSSPRKRPRLSVPVPKSYFISVPHIFHDHTKEPNSEPRVSSLPIHNNFQLLPPPAPVKPPFNAIWRHRSVWITGDEVVFAAWNEAGPLGKANLSRSAPAFSEGAFTPIALRGRAMRQRLSMENANGMSNTARVDVEHLQLSLVEAYHAAFMQCVIQIRNRNGQLLDDPLHVWRLFCEEDPTFAVMLVAFCRYRAAGWFPRSGLKYGVDWVLYPTSVTRKHAHAPYCVRTRVISDQDDVPLDRTWVSLQNRLRLVKNVAKTLVVANIVVQGGAKKWNTPHEAFKSIKINEVTIDRWVP